MFFSNVHGSRLSAGNPRQPHAVTKIYKYGPVHPRQSGDPKQYRPKWVSASREKSVRICVCQIVAATEDSDGSHGESRAKTRAHSCKSNCTRDFEKSIRLPEFFSKSRQYG